MRQPHEMVKHTQTVRRQQLKGLRAFGLYGCNMIFIRSKPWLLTRPQSLFESSMMS